MIRAAALLGLLSLPFAVSAAFSDVSPTSESRRPIEYLQTIGVLQGYEDGRFRPAFPINRAELLKVLVVAKGVVPDAQLYAGCFPDVTDQWYAPYVCYAREQGWVQGYPDGSFGPERQVLFVEALKMLVNVRGYPPAPSEESAKRGIDSTAWFAPYLTTSLLLDVVSFEQVWGTTSIPLHTPLKRGFVAQLLYRSLLAESSLQFPLAISACSFLPTSLEIQTYVDVLHSSKKNVFRQEFRGIGPEGETCIFASDANPFSHVVSSFDAYFLQPYPEGQPAQSWIARVPLMNGRAILRPSRLDGGAFRPEVFVLDLLGGSLRQLPSVFTSHKGSLLTADRRFLAYIGASGRTVEVLDLETGLQTVIDVVQDPLTFVDPKNDEPDLSLPLDSVNIIAYTLYDASVMGANGQYVLEQRTVDLDTILAQPLTDFSSPPPSDPFNDTFPVLP